MIGFNLDKSVRLTFYEQIKGQLLSAIYCGKIRAGDRLPSIREVSDHLRRDLFAAPSIDLHAYEVL